MVEIIGFLFTCMRVVFYQSILFRSCQNNNGGDVFYIRAFFYQSKFFLSCQNNNGGDGRAIPHYFTYELFMPI